LGFLKGWFSLFPKLQECLVKLLKIVVVLYVGSNDCYIQDKGRGLDFIKSSSLK
jgi:hypothetical protein